MKNLNEQISDVIEQEPVAVFMKGTPQMIMCGNSHRALQALHAAGAPITAVDILPDPRIRQELSSISGWPTIPQVFVRGELIGGADITEELAASGELQQKLDDALGLDRAQDVKVVELQLAYAAAIRSASSREIACSPSCVRTVTGPPNGAYATSSSVEPGTSPSSPR
jgi:monothiol glutaredoxin